VKLQVDITADTKDDLMTALDGIMIQLDAGATNGEPDYVGATGRFEILEPALTEAVGE
jgi:hypothetical protein